MSVYEIPPGLSGRENEEETPEKRSEFPLLEEFLDEHEVPAPKRERLRRLAEEYCFQLVFPPEGRSETQAAGAALGDIDTRLREKLTGSMNHGHSKHEPHDAVDGVIRQIHAMAGEKTTAEALE